MSDLSHAEVSTILRLAQYRLKLDKQRYERDAGKRKAKGVEPDGPLRDSAKHQIERLQTIVDKLTVMKG
jgi:hypothetical protein